MVELLRRRRSVAKVACIVMEPTRRHELDEKLDELAQRRHGVYHRVHESQRQEDHKNQSISKAGHRRPAMMPLR